MEEERAEILARLLLLDAELVEQLVEDCAFHVQSLMLLREITELHAAAELHAARRRRELADEHAQQRRLARAVRPDERHAVAAANEQVDMGENLMLPVPP